MTFTTFDASQLPSNQTNIIDNASMEVWQRGTSFTNFTGYCADRWFMSTSCTNYSVSQESSIIDSGAYSMKLVITTAAGGVFRICQSPENPAQYVGKVMTFSARVKSNVAGFKLFVSYIGGQTASTIAHTGDNTWQTLSMTITIPNQGITFCAGFDSVNTTVGSSVSPSAGTFYLDSVSLVYGPNAPSVFIPLHPAIDLMRCQRYYEFGTLDMLHPVWSNSNTVLTCYYARDFRVGKAFAPTVTITKPTTVFLDNLSPNSTGGSNGSYTSDPGANWTASSGAVTTGSFQCTMSRASATPSVSNLMESGPTWVASADL